MGEGKQRILTEQLGEEEESLAAADHDVLILSELTALGEDLQTQLLKTARLRNPDHLPQPWPQP